MIQDIEKIRTDLSLFNDLTTEDSSFDYTGDKQRYTSQLVLPIERDSGTVSKSILKIQDVFIPFSTSEDFKSSPFRRAYMILSNEITDAKRYETFKNAMIGNIIGNAGIIGKGFDDIEKQFDAYWLTVAKPQYITENNIAKEFINSVEKDKLKSYLIYTPFDKKERVLNYTTDTSQESSVTIAAQETLIKGLGASTNGNTNNKTWNDLVGGVFGTYVSKAKLN
jgi:hypothetical protein